MATGLAAAPTEADTARAPKRNSAARFFGFDVFISFALGPPPRGTQSYASDLARRLRERDFTVFFSEDEASPASGLTAPCSRPFFAPAFWWSLLTEARCASLAGRARKSSSSAAVIPTDRSF